MGSLLQHMMLETPSSVYVKVAGATTLFGLAKAGWSEVQGTNMSYSKFANNAPSNSIKLSSRNGMLVSYAPALIASSAFLAFHSSSSSAAFIGLASALTLHFLKRCLEVLFVHKYSGQMELQTTTLISLNYLSICANLLYAQQILESTSSLSLSAVGWGACLVGMVGNLYHHLILSSLRSDEKRYVIPEGGLFSMVICPHYLFEVVEWFGIACICQTWFGLVVALGTLFYLSGRSYATKKWYLSKFEGFPEVKKTLIPFLF